MITKFIREDDGATAIEYGLIATLIGLAIIIAVAGVGTALNSTFSNVSSHLN